MRMVELFAGIGGFRLAAEKRGFRTVWVNDICPRACRVYADRFGDRELRQGDIRDWVGDIPPHELLTAGFPCQPFSSAGKKHGVRDPRGTLFQIIVEVLRRHEPAFFILENVKRLLTMEKGQHFAAILSSLAELNYHIEWRLLNAMDLGLPQNRQRVFLLGVRLPGESCPGPNPLERVPIRLARVEELTGCPGHDLESAWDPAQWTGIAAHMHRFPGWGRALGERFFAATLTGFFGRQPLVPLRAVLEPNVPDEFDFTEATLRWLRDNRPVNRLVQGVEVLSNQAGGARMGYTIFGINGVAPTLTSTTSRHYERYKVGDRYRRLTNREYARIQGFPDDHCSAVSVYDQYALLGNAVPPSMAGWVLDCLARPGLTPHPLAVPASPREPRTETRLAGGAGGKHPGSRPE